MSGYRRLDDSITLGNSEIVQHVDLNANEDDIRDEVESKSIDTHVYKRFNTLQGVTFICMSALCSGLGNSLDSMSTLSMFHPFCLIVGLEVSAGSVEAFYANVSLYLGLTPACRLILTHTHL